MRQKKSRKTRTRSYRPMRKQAPTRTLRRAAKGGYHYQDLTNQLSIGAGAYGNVVEYSGLVWKTMSASWPGDWIKALREAVIMTNVKNHPHLVQLRSLAVQEDNVQFAMKKYAKVKDIITGPIGPIRTSLACKCALDLIKGLDFMHNVLHVMHRDIKPDNTLFCEGAGEDDGNFVICDFGLAQYIYGDTVKNIETQAEERIRSEIDDTAQFKKFQSNRNAETNVSIVSVDETRDETRVETRQRTYSSAAITSWYRPPEMFVNEADTKVAYNQNADMWSVGCCLVEFLTAKPLFSSAVNKKKWDKKVGFMYQEIVDDPALIRTQIDQILEELFTDNSPLNGDLNTALGDQSEKWYPLLRRMLETDPLKRVSASSALSYLEESPDRSEPTPLTELVYFNLKQFLPDKPDLNGSRQKLITIANSVYPVEDNERPWEKYVLDPDVVWARGLPERPRSSRVY
jgi:serine/threonine protein kinase